MIVLHHQLSGDESKHNSILRDVARVDNRGESVKVYGGGNSFFHHHLVPLSINRVSEIRRSLNETNTHRDFPLPTLVVRSPADIQERDITERTNLDSRR